MKPPRPGPRDSGPDARTLPVTDPAQVQVIRTYGPGRFLIGDREWRCPVLVTPSWTTDWPVERADDVSLDNLASLRSAEMSTELVVLGCGARTVFIRPGIRATLRAAGMGLEAVDTGSACRMYNVLLAEGRRVAAALIPL